ncbi:MAG TPA: hypothetical protein VMM55_09800 [Thermohalobaculum sp.]|nr:hypothetical protein [Thermohalobaculum sp.]
MDQQRLPKTLPGRTGLALRAPSEAEREAVAAARALIAERQAEGRHHVAASLIADDGRLFTFLNLESVLGQAARCAEPAALSAALSHPEPPAAIVFSCAVNRRGEVLPPCGLCRELFLDLAPDIELAVPMDGFDFAVTTLRELMPMPYKAGRRAMDP